MSDLRFCERKRAGDVRSQKKPKKPGENEDWRSVEALVRLLWRAAAF